MSYNNTYDIYFPKSHIDVQTGKVRKKAIRQCLYDLEGFMPFKDGDDFPFYVLPANLDHIVVEEDRFPPGTLVYRIECTSDRESVILEAAYDRILETFEAWKEIGDQARAEIRRTGKKPYMRHWWGIGAEEEEDDESYYSPRDWRPTGPRYEDLRSLKEEDEARRSFRRERELNRGSLYGEDKRRKWARRLSRFV